jgi:hypothetical protein
VAKAALRELGPVGARTPSADFNPARLDGWFPTILCGSLDSIIRTSRRSS